MLRIELKDSTISIGKWYTHRYVVFSPKGFAPNVKPAWEVFTQEVLACNDIDTPKGMRKKEKYQWYAQQLGRSPTKMCAHFNGLQFKTYVGDNLPIVKKLCAGTGGRINPNKLDKFNRAKDKILQAVEDGLLHLTPLIMQYNETPQELKKRYGNGVWKSVTKNTFSRNVLVSKVAPAHCTRRSKTLQFVSKHHPEGWLVEPVENATKGIPLKRWSEYLGVVHLVRDTMRMLEQLGEKYNPQWSLRRVKEEHERAAQEVMKRLYTAEPFDMDERVVREMSLGGFSASLLDSPLKLKEEGNAMRHCVASYVDSVKDSSYSAYRIRDAEGKRSSTLGLRAHTNGQIQFSQHYGYGNSCVESEDEKLLTEVILHQLQSNFKG